MVRHSFFLCLLVSLMTTHAWAFSEVDISPEELERLMQEWKPLEVSGDAIPWSLFAKTKELEECVKDEENGWTNCIIKPDYSEEVQALDGQEVTLMGFMFPLDETEKQKNFLIGPYPISCPFHYHVGPSQMVEVLAEESVNFSYDPVTLKGTLRVRFNQETEVFFYLEQAGQS